MVIYAYLAVNVMNRSGCHANTVIAGIFKSFNLKMNFMNFSRSIIGQSPKKYPFSFKKHKHIERLSKKKDKKNRENTKEFFFIWHSYST